MLGLAYDIVRTQLCSTVSPVRLVFGLLVMTSLTTSPSVTCLTLRSRGVSPQHTFIHQTGNMGPERNLFLLFFFKGKPPFFFNHAKESLSWSHQQKLI